MKDPYETACQRLEALRLAEEIDNVSEACRRCGISRTQFYEYKRRYKEQGFEGLIDRPRTPHQKHPFATTSEDAAKIVEMNLLHPKWSARKINDVLQRRGISVSATTIRKILVKYELGNLVQRLRRLEHLYLEEEIDLTNEQASLLYDFNPCLRERHAESQRPGELLVYARLLFLNIPGFHKVFLHTTVDTYSCYAFGHLSHSLDVQASIRILKKKYERFYQKLELSVSTPRPATPGGYIYLHSYKTNGFLWRFNQIVRSDFVRGACQGKNFTSLKTLRDAFNEWLEFYNTERPHEGYRNMGQTPLQAVVQYVETVRKEP
jgi:transposase InsO family protein